MRILFDSQQSQFKTPVGTLTPQEECTIKIHIPSSVGAKLVECVIQNEDGTQYGVNDWTRDLARNLRTNLGLKVTNQAQGLGKVQLLINNQ